MASSGAATVTLPTDQQILITREFDAPRRLVYRAWTSPELVKRWYAGRRGEMTSVEIDLREGGRWRYVMLAHGEFEVAFHGEFREILPDERIVSTEIYEGMPDAEALTTTTFAETNGRTTLEILVQHASKNDRDSHLNSGMEAGMNESLDLLEQVARSSANPADVPASRPASLDRFDALIGEWEMEASFEAGYFAPDSPAITNRGGRTTFEWLPGRFFLTQRFVSDHPAAPSGIAIIGPTDEPEILSQHYYDSRGVARVYKTSLDQKIWRVWRESPGFWQRYTGVVSDDSGRIDGAWEGSSNGRDWTRDFGLAYIRLSEA